MTRELVSFVLIISFLNVTNAVHFSSHSQDDVCEPKDRQQTTYSSPSNRTSDPSTPPPRQYANVADRLPNHWAADAFYRALSDFTVRHDGVRETSSAACREQTETYVDHLKNNTYWAIKMYESWNRYPIGLLAGSTHQMGVYDECINVHLPVQGKYCMASVKLSSIAGKTFQLNNKDDLDDYDNAWNEILGFVDYKDRYRRNEVNLGVCIPEACTAMELQTSLQNKLDDVFLPHRVQPRVKVEPILCSTDKDVYPFDTGYYVTWMLIFSIISLCCSSTIYHLIVMTLNKDSEKQRNMPEIMCWFSIIHNGRILIKYEKNNKLDMFNGIKVVFMFSTLYVHAYIVYITHPMSYALNVEKMYRDGPYAVLTMTNIVDPFLFISAYLLYVTTKPQLIKCGTGWTNLPKILLYKYFRMMPTYGMVILFVAYIAPHLKHSPFWAAIVWPEADKCKNYWWTNILGITNFIAIDKNCYITGWYVSCLLQLIVIGTVLINVCVKNRKIGVRLINVLLCTSLVVPFVLTYITRSYGISKMLLSYIENPNLSYEFNIMYMPFYNRGVPFCSGLLAAVVIEQLKEKKFKLSKLVVNISTLIMIVLCIKSQLYSGLFYDRHRPYNVIEHSMYATLDHCNWSSLLFWISICHFTSDYGPIENILNNQLMTILGRLTYSIYLVNHLVILETGKKQSTAFSPTTDLLLDNWLLILFKSYLASIALHLFIEAPFNAIVKTIFYGNENNSNEKNDKEPGTETELLSNGTGTRRP